MRWQTILASLALTSAALSGCSKGLAGSGTARTETRTVSGFTRVELDTIGEVTLTQSDRDSLSIEADDNLLPHLTSAVSGDRLLLRSDASIRPRHPNHYTITVKSLAGLDVAGLGNVTASSIRSPSLQVRVSGAGNVTASGQADTEEVTLAGAGDFDGSKLTSRSATVVVSGAGNAKVQPSESLDATITGAGNVEYTGNPTVKQSISGAGSVRKR